MPEPFNLIYGGGSDWPKRTLDIPAKSPEEMRYYLDMMGETVEHFKTLDAYKLALASDNYPWLAEL